jgi:hypothetical protein
VSQGAQATVTEPNHIIDQGLTYRFYKWWAADLDYRYSRFTSNAAGNFTSLFNGTTPTSATTDVVWRDGISDLRLDLDFTPLRGLIIRPGVQFLKADVESLTNGVVNSPITLRTKTARPIISFGYEPSKTLSVRGDFHTTTNGASYTAMSPHTEQGGRFVVHYHPLEKVSIEYEAAFTNSHLLQANFQSDMISNAITISYALGPRFSVLAGFTYDNFYAQGNIVYARGTPPLNDFLRDQEVNRVWQGGIEGKPTKRLGLRVTGNFDRSTGRGQLSGEPPAYGPVTWPLATGTVYYDVPMAGRLAVDLQRTYYIEQIVPGNNFSANLLTIRWTKAF